MNVFVLGWYDNQNLGDEAFKDAFRHLWPQANFTFSSDIRKFDPQVHGALWLGGGDIFGGNQFLELPPDVPVAVIGVGISGLNDAVRRVLDRAQIVIVRDHASKTAYPRAHLAPDLIFSLPERQIPPSENMVLMLLNDFFSPRRHSPWGTQVHNGVFVNEMAKVVDGFVAQKKRVVFAPMGVGGIDDRRAAAQVIGLLARPTAVDWILDPVSDDSLWDLVGRSSLVVTQRFHGMVYSAVSDRPCVAICGHKKLWELGQEIMPKSTVDYYGFTDRAFYTALTSQQQEQNFQGYRERAKALWRGLSAVVEKEFSL